MNIFIHFGIYKAGSSYLQYIAANKRDELCAMGIWFPFSDDDDKMLNGSISAGNAFNLSEWLKKNEADKIEEYLVQIKDEAKSRNCHSILLTAEALIHQFARKDRLLLLFTLLEKTGFKNINAIAFFRDLVDHSISLYKHRSKSGRNPDFEYWLKEVYEAPLVLNEFFSNFQEVDFNWTLKRFKKDSDYLIKTFFNEWLNINLEQIPQKPTVNESISLSEVKLMYNFKKLFPYTSDYLLNRLMNLPKQKKANDRVLELYYRKNASEILSSLYSNYLTNWNEHLLKNDALSIEIFNERVNASYTEIYLSDEQLALLLKSTQYLTSINSLGFRFRRYIKTLIPSQYLNLIVKVYK